MILRRRVGDRMPGGRAARRAFRGRILPLAARALHRGRGSNPGRYDHMRFNRVKKLWREGKPAVGGWLSIPHCLPAEVMAHTGLDWLCIDMQHGCIDYSDTVPMLTAISTTNVVPFVRVPWNEPALIMKGLDAGAYSVIVPVGSKRAEAERAVAACRYPPVGMRSNGPNRVLLYAGADYQKHANAEVACIVMVETTEGIEKIDEIAATPGVDAVYIG